MSETVTVATWLKWAWVHGTLDVDVCDDLEEAIASAWVGREMGSESFAFIEGPNGVVPDEQVRAEMDRRDEEESARYRERPKNTHAVRVRTPGGEHEAWAGHFTDEAKAWAHARKLAATVGSDRVRVVALPSRP